MGLLKAVEELTKDKKTLIIRRKKRAVSKSFKKENKITPKRIMVPRPKNNITAKRKEIPKKSSTEEKTEYVNFYLKTRLDRIVGSLKMNNGTTITELSDKIGIKKVDLGRDLEILSKNKIISIKYPANIFSDPLILLNKLIFLIIESTLKPKSSFLISEIIRSVSLHRETPSSLEE